MLHSTGFAKEAPSTLLSYLIQPFFASFLLTQPRV